MQIDALILAGGRVEGEYAAALGTSVKALAPVGERTALERVARAVAALPQIRRVCVVGPEEARGHLPHGALWHAETGTALGNLETGLGALGIAGEGRVLLCGSDTPLIRPEGLEGFLARVPDAADVALPLVRREAFLAAFPASENTYIRLAEGHFTGGSQFLLRPAALLRNRDLLENLFEQRKSQLGMARALGLGLAIRFLMRRLAVADVERRLSRLTGCACHAVPDCDAGLAFDIDLHRDWQYACQLEEITK